MQIYHLYQTYRDCLKFVGTPRTLVPQNLDTDLQPSASHMLYT